LAYKIEYKSSVFRELKHLDKRIAREIRESLSLDPSCGEPLTGQFKGMRVGDYRIIYSKTKDGVLILRIGHRSIVYEK